MSHDEFCPCVTTGVYEPCRCDFILMVAERERKRLVADGWVAPEQNEAMVAVAKVRERMAHHKMEVQGGYVRTCCPACKSHVQPHVRCMLRDDYTGPLPEGHRWDDDA